MTMLDIILEKNRLNTSHYADQEFSDYGNFSVASAMKEYAEWYAKECLKIAAEQAYMSKQGVGMITNSGSIWNCEINKDSILNIKLPDHD